MTWPPDELDEPAGLGEPGAQYVREGALARVQRQVVLGMSKFTY